MNQIILKLLKENNGSTFHFSPTELDPVKHLRNVTKNVPNTSGLYFVFIYNVTDSDHLTFSFDNKKHKLIYFGKAGGLTKKGRLIKQGLRGRINNVVSDSSLGLKDIKRAIYWKIKMDELNTERIIIKYIELLNPSENETRIYRKLNDEKLKFPLLNKILGRKKPKENFKNKK